MCLFWYTEVWPVACAPVSRHFIVGSDGNWWLGDFGSAVKSSEPILSTTELFNPQKLLLGTPALPKYDWYMLAAALIKEVLKHKGEDA